MQAPLGVRLLDAVLPEGLASDLPLVIAGAMGTGRTVLSLEIAAAGVQRGEPVTLLLAEPGDGVLQEAASLGLDLEAAFEARTLTLLEMDSRAADLAHRQGLVPLAEALLEESEDASTIVIDPVSSLIPELFDERAVRGLMRPFLDRLRRPGRRIVLTYDTDAALAGRGYERTLADLAAAYLELERGPRGHVLKVGKVRGPNTSLPRIEFAIGAGGSYPLTATHEERVAPPRVAAIADPNVEPPRVVVALENDEERAQIAEWLGDGYELLLCNDGLRAVSLACTQSPRLLVLEPQLRGASGYEVLRALRSAGVRVPILTALHHKARAVDRVRPLVLGATDVIAKPFNSFELVHRVRTLSQLPRTKTAEAATDEAELLFVVQKKSRVTSEPDFLDHAGRAVRIGERFGFPSTLLGLETDSDDAFELLASSADHLLRVEDAFCPVSDRRAVVLLVCSGERQAHAVTERIYRDLRQRGGETRPILGWATQAARALGDGLSALQPDWSGLFKDLHWLREELDADGVARLRLVARHS